MTRQDQIVNLAREQVGKQYAHKAHGPERFDCLGLVYFVAQRIGLDVPQMGDYSRNPSGMMMRRALRKHAPLIRFSDAGRGDFIHMAWTRQPQHMAIISGVDPYTIIHADAVAGAVVEHVLSEDLSDRVRDAYRFPEA